MSSRKLKLLMLCGLSWMSVFGCSPREAPRNPITAKLVEPTIESTIGHFEGEKLHNSTEKTYRLPNIGAFASYFPRTRSIASGLLVELYDKKQKRGLFNWFKYDLHVSEQRLGLAVGRKIFDPIDGTASIVYSRDFDRRQHTWGLAFSLVKF